MNINPFHATGLFLHPLKTSKNQRFSDVFRGYRKIPVTRNGLKQNNHVNNNQKQKLFWKFLQNLQENMGVGKGDFDKPLRNRCFSLNIGKFLRAPVLQNTSGWVTLRDVTSENVFESLQISIITLNYSKF